MDIINNAIISARSPSLRHAVFKVLILRIYKLSMDVSTRSAPISLIRGSERPYGAEFPLVVPGREHTVLYYLHRDGTLVKLPPKPLQRQDKWSRDYVRLPCSEQSEYPAENERPQSGKPKLVKRWDMIRNALKRTILDSKQLAEAILSYNHMYKNTWKFKALHALFDGLDEDECTKFFHFTLPAIAGLVLALPDLIQSPIPLLKQKQNHSISMSQQQIACLLANAFFCTFPRRNSRSQKEYDSYPYINFSSLYESEPYNDALEKLKCLINYFVRVTQRMPEGVVTFTRRAVPATSCPRWERSEVPVSCVPLHVDADGMIERANGLIQLDFANKYLGGGVLGHGCVQEEIRFVTCPELMVSMLFTEVLGDTEALVMIGAERYSKYLGYGHTFEWAGSYVDDAPRDSSARRNTAVLAIDALPFKNPAAQYKKQNIDRELNKAWVGFSAYGESQGGDRVNYPGVATGNWGCGAFRGSPPLKSLIQLMACAEARRPIAYFTFKDYKFRDELIDIYEELSRHHVTVGQLYRHLVRFADSKAKKSDLFSYLRQVLRDGSRSSPAPPTEATTARDTEQQETPRPKEIGLRSESPDLFSQDEEQNQETDKLEHPIKQTNQEKIESSYDGRKNICKTEMTDSDAQIIESFFDASDSDLKISDNDTKLPNDTGAKMSDNLITLPNSSSYMSESGEKLPNRSIKMSDCDIRSFVNNTKMSNEFDGGINNSEKEFKITIDSLEDGIKNTKDIQNNDTKNATSNIWPLLKSTLFDEMQKFDDENGKLNVSYTNTTSAAKRSIAALNDSDVSMESDEKEVPPEPKKKIICSKITDYFTSNPI